MLPPPPAYTGREPRSGLRPTRERGEETLVTPQHAQIQAQGSAFDVDVGRARGLAKRPPVRHVDAGATGDQPLEAGWEIGAALGTGVSHLVLQELIGFHGAFVVAAVVAWSTYVYTRARREPDVLAAWGFRRQNFARSSSS